MLYLRSSSLQCTGILGPLHASLSLVTLISAVQTLTTTTLVRLGLKVWELYARWRIYAPVKFTASPKIYPVSPKALSKKIKSKTVRVLLLAFVSG